MTRPRPVRHLWLVSIQPSAAPFSHQGQQPFTQGEVNGYWCRAHAASGLGRWAGRAAGCAQEMGRRAWKLSSAGLAESSRVLAEFMGLEKAMG